MVRPEGTTATPLAVYPTQGYHQNRQLEMTYGSKSSTGAAKPAENLGQRLCH